MCVSAREKEQAGMKRKQLQFEAASSEKELGALGGLDSKALKQRWRVLYRTAPPPRISSSLLYQALAYRLQEKALGGLKSSARRLLDRVAEDRAGPHLASTLTAKARAGTVLIREWHGVSHRVTALEDGVLLRGTRYRSLSEAARKITGTRWSGPRFFGLNVPLRKCSDHGHCAPSYQREKRRSCGHLADWPWLEVRRYDALVRT
jgi:hypothetical protein